jgi:hypothetical protein
VPFVVEQQLVRVDAVGIPFGELAQGPPVAHADPAASRFQVGLGGVEHVARGAGDDVAVEAGAAFFIDSHLLRHFALAVAAQ